MKQILSLFLSSLIVFSFACSENKSSSEAMEEVPVQELQATIDTPAAEVISEGQVQTGQEVNQPSNSIIPVNTNKSLALNPAHGEPGHDCSIAVGAPLNSAKSGASQQSQPIMQNGNAGQIQPNSVTSTPAASPAPVMAIPNNKTPAGTSGKVNPAHGEPGHDCSKPVGEPL